VVETLAIKCQRAAGAPAAHAGGCRWGRCQPAPACQLAEAWRNARWPFRHLLSAPEFCTDNGAMIAFAGALRLHAGQFNDAADHGFSRAGIWQSLPALA
jgi:N6-L-threonylcarbamoyladenine synthase